MLSGEGQPKLKTEGDQSHRWSELLQETSLEGTDRLGEPESIKDCCLSLRLKTHVVGVVRGGNWKDRLRDRQWKIRHVLMEDFCMEQSYQ